MNEERDPSASGEERPGTPEEPQPEDTAAGAHAAEDDTAEFETVPAPNHAEPSRESVAEAAGEPDATLEWPAADATSPDATTSSSGPPPVEAEAYAPPPGEEQPAGTAAHAVPPAAPTGESTQCPRCGTENRPGVAFCRNCGQRLVAPGVSTTVERPSAPEGTQQCPRCGTHNRAGVAFCQNCGANLRVSATPAAGYVPPSAQQAGGSGAAASQTQAAPASRGGAILGPIVLLVAAIGLGTAWWLPFPYGTGSLWERSFGTPGGYGIAFWQGYGAVTGGVLDSAYFGFAAAAPILIAIIVLLAAAGFLRGAPGGLQLLFLVIALLWAIGLIACFLVLEVGGNWNGDVVAVLRVMTPAGIIFLLAGLILVIGVLTRFARS